MLGETCVVPKSAVPQLDRVRVPARLGRSNGGDFVLANASAAVVGADGDRELLCCSERIDIYRMQATPKPC